MIHKNTPSVDYSLWLKRWDNQLNELTNSIKVAKVVVLMTYCYQMSTTDWQPLFSRRKKYLWYWNWFCNDIFSFENGKIFFNFGFAIKITFFLTRFTFSFFSIFCCLHFYCKLMASFYNKLTFLVAQLLYIP